MIKAIVAVVLAGSAAVAAAMSWPDLKRYLRIRRM